MVFQEIYKFRYYDYDDEGINIETGIYFLDIIKAWEIEFHNTYPLGYANYLFANESTMILLNKCLDLDKSQKCGMELINGEIDIDTNIEIGKFSDITTVYAFNSQIEENIEEPLFLVIDEKIKDGKVLLKFIPDDDSEEDESHIPVNSDLIKMK